GGVRRFVAGAVAFQKTGAIVQVARGEAAPGQCGRVSDAEGVALVVIEIEQLIRRRRKIGKAAGDGAASLDKLMRIGQMHLSAPEELGGANGTFPAANAGAVNRERKKDVGIAQNSMIKEVPGMGAEGINLERPVLNGHRHAGLVFLIAL